MTTIPYRPRRDLEQVIAEVRIATNIILYGDTGDTYSKLIEEKIIIKDYNTTILPPYYRQRTNAVGQRIACFGVTVSPHYNKETSF